MIATVVRGDAYNQEVWEFILVDSYTGRPPMFYLRRYRIEHKKPGQRKWRVQEEWETHDHRYKPNPPLPNDVVTEAKEQLVAQIRNLEIQPVEK